MISWLLDLVLTSIPAWLWLVGSGASLAIFLLSGILSHFPGLGPYAKFLKPVSGLVTLVCVFMYGGAGVQGIEYRDRIKTEIKEVEKLINQKCEIDPKVPELLNKAAKNPTGESK